MNWHCRVSGVLPASVACARAEHALVVPCDNSNEACLSENTRVYGAEHLLDVCAHLRGDITLSPSVYHRKVSSLPCDSDDLVRSWDNRRQNVHLK